MRTLVLLSIAFATQLASAAEPALIGNNIAWRAEYDSAYREMQAEQRPMLVYIKSDACLYCRRMESTYNDPTVVNEVRGRFVPTVINSTTNPALARKLGARVYPTTVIISADGNIVDAIPGYLTADQFHARLRTAKTR
ncbi:MAG: thioredoxin family protein [Planctomycetales bacterium]|nr:thioredoxin family protein [Planctomycetales bacterium]